MCFHIKWPYLSSFSPPEKKIELTFILCGLISVPVFLISLSRSLQMLRFFVTQIYQKIRTFTHKHEIHQHIICPPLKKNKKRCWLFFKKKKIQSNKTHWKKQNLGGRRGKQNSVCFSPLFFCYLLCFLSFFPYSLTWPSFLYRSMGSKEKPRRVWLAIIIISLSIKPDTIIITLPFFLPLPPFQFIIHCFFFV